MVVTEPCHSTLLHFLNNPSNIFSENIITEIIYQLAEALKIMHKENVVHRSISLSNIFIDENYKVKLGDFFLAKKLNPTDLFNS